MKVGQIYLNFITWVYNFNIPLHSQIQHATWRFFNPKPPFKSKTALNFIFSPKPAELQFLSQINLKWVHEVARLAQVVQSCKQGFADLSNLWGFLWSQRVKMRPAIGGEKAVLSPQSSIFNPQSSVLRNAPKNLIYGILVANVARISTYALWG